MTIMLGGGEINRRRQMINVTHSDMLAAARISGMEFSVGWMGDKISMMLLSLSSTRFNVFFRTEKKQE